MAAGPAAAHVTVAPAFVATNEIGKLVFSAPNEREAPMTGFSVIVPKGFRIVTGGHQPTWHPTVQGSKVTWSGGSLPARKRATFDLELEGRAEPGLVDLHAEQLYPTGEVVRWPVAITVIPGTQPSQHLGWAVVAAAAGLLATGLFVVLAWRRRERPLQER
jgi:uncharacterized protein YcnI